MPSKETGRAQPGDVYAAPVTPDQFALLKVIYVSRAFRNLIGVALADALTSSAFGELPSEFPGPIIYTAQACAQKKWRFVANQRVTSAERLRTTRIVAGSVLCGDDELRPASDDDYQLLTQMAASGYGAVLKHLARFYKIQVGGAATGA